MLPLLPFHFPCFVTLSKKLGTKPFLRIAKQKDKANVREKNLSSAFSKMVCGSGLTTSLLQKLEI
jgi:hypothetical protein